jgi:DNA helicase-2/ATP-dependent DNA helicase PcrA
MVNYIHAQEEVLGTIQEKIKHLPNKNLNSLKELEVSIAQLNEEVKNAKAEDVPSIMYQLNILHSLAEKLTENNAFPDLNSPYFGFMKIEQEGKEKEIYVGHCALSEVDLKQKIVDWKRAPIAKIFYQYDIGEDFDLDLEDREISGKMIDKAILTIQGGKLLRVDRDRQTYVYQADQQKWVNINQEILELSGGEQSSYGEFGTGRTNYQSADVLSLLDKAQFELVHRDSKAPLLIIGSAGSGKTTVALFRLMQMIQTRKVFPNQSLVLVPNKGLVKLSQALLEKVNIKRVSIQVLQEWIENIARRVFVGLPKTVVRSAPLYVQIVKRHHLLMESINLLLEDQEKSIRETLRVASQDLLAKYDAQKGMAIIPRLKRLLTKEIGQTKAIVVQQLLEKFTNVREDLYHLMTGEKYLQTLYEKSEGKVAQHQLKELKIYQTKLSLGYDRDRDYLESQGLQGDNLESYGRDSDSKDKIDQEDFILMLLLAKRKWGNLHEVRQPMKKLRHILLDEAQEVHPFELEIISEFIHEKASLTVAGDAAQNIDESNSFLGWDHVMNQLGYADVATDELNVSYRSPQNITELAHHILGPLAPKDAPETTKSGGRVLESQIQHSAHGAIELTKALRDLSLREPRASVAVICSNMNTAREYYEILSELGNTRLVQDADFSFKPGIDITIVEHIRGLEFDYVIIPDANANNYPIQPRARKRLHLAVTRAIHQIWLMFDGKKSALLP